MTTFTRDAELDLAESVKKYNKIKTTYEDIMVDMRNYRDNSHKRVLDLKNSMTSTREEMNAYKTIEPPGESRDKAINIYIDNMCFIHFRIRTVNIEIKRVEYEFDKFKNKIEGEMDEAFNSMMKIAYQ